MRKFCFAILIFAICILNFIGCATIIEGAKGFAGISTKVLQESRKDAITKNFNFDYNTCYNNVQEILRRIGTYIYAKDVKKNMIAIYVSKEDTTPVGLFFTQIDTTHTQIEVSSPSTYAKEYIAGKIFSALDKSVSIEELEAEINAKKELETK